MLVMTMIMGGRSFKLPYAFLTLFVLVHLMRLALGGVISGVGDANNSSCPEGERQALLEFKKGISSDPEGGLSSWGSEDEKRNCCNWLGIYCSNQTGHVIQLRLQFYSLRGTQLQGFDATCFIGNRALCGPPLKQKCPVEETPNQRLPTDNGSTEDDEDNRDEFKKRFYVGAGIGFAVAFWGMCSSLILKRSWRHAYFLLLDNMKDWLYVTMAVNKARFWRMFQRQG